MANGKSNKKKKIIIIGAVSFLVILLVVVLFSGGGEVFTKVQTEKTSARDIIETVSATGKINPEFQVILRPEVTGEIVELPVEEGNEVDKGELLIRIKPEQYQAQRNRAEANWEAAKATLKIRQANLDQVTAEYNRIQDLNEKGLESERSLEIAKANYLQNLGMYEAQKSAVMQAHESLKEAEVQLSKTTIYSPLDGVVSALNVELSERVLGSSFSQGTHIMTVADLNVMEAIVEVDENDIIKIEPGDSANIEIDAFGKKIFKGIVTQIGNSAITTGLGTQNEVVNFNVKIRIKLDGESKIKPGMSCNADIITEVRKGVLSVPIQSVTAREPKKESKKDGLDAKASGEKKKDKELKEVVFVVENGKAKMKEVVKGISDNDYIEIISGLEEDEEVVSGPYKVISKDLKDGTKVSTNKKKKPSNKEEDETVEEGKTT